ncbi:MAG: orotate phosphoribosyltransferase [Defluviitaleaceae bacterium]|nr:orotate phosphoribosyltransferase [Defluviitaleaceae bacterium]
MNKVEQILVETGALLNGHFQLTSGRHGQQYMQCAKVLQYPEHTAYIAEVIAQGFQGQEVDIVLAPAIGGIVMGYELARALKAKSLFVERENGEMTLRRGFEIPKGAKVVIAEDVVTTGGTTKEVIEIAKAHGAEVVGVGIMVDRSGGQVDLGAKVVAAYSKAIVSYTPEECPLCKEGVEIVKPGSRKI